LLAILVWAGITCPGAVHAQTAPVSKTVKDSIIIIPADPSGGFQHAYILFIPKGTALNHKTFLLVEPNNTGIVTDDIKVHKEHAIRLASVSSVGNNISTELHIPLLVPIFPRPLSDSLVYTHALDRDVMLEKSGPLKRLDLQLLNMIRDAKAVLKKMNVHVNDKVFMHGFSASGSFTNRFSFLHPGAIQALAIGGFNGELMLPEQSVDGQALNYPLGIHDTKKLTGKSFDSTAYNRIPQYIYLGRLDDNDAVQYDDAYNEAERKLINEHLGAHVQERYLACQDIYRQHHIPAIFASYDGVGHWTTSAVNLDVIRFFMKEMGKESDH
jgi:hypothetical protein